ASASMASTSPPTVRATPTATRTRTKPCWRWHTSATTAVSRSPDQQASEQFSLRRRLARRREARAVEPKFASPAEAVLAAGHLEALAQQFGEHALAAHAG